MRASPSPLLLVPLLLWALAGAAAAAASDWQEAIAQMEGEREKAETCLDLLHRHGDEGLIAQGETRYAAAKAHMDLVYAGLAAALAGRAPEAGQPAFEASLVQAIRGRQALCRLLDGLLDEPGGAKDPLVDVMEDTVGPSTAALGVLIAKGRAPGPLRTTIGYQLEAAHWPAAGQIPVLYVPPSPVGGPTPAPDGRRDGGLVYPVWFGTNRRPGPERDRAGLFTNERHDRITYGRTEVWVPEAHRFGETGSPFWRRLLRLDLRDDRLRLRGVTVQDWEDWVAGLEETMAAARREGDGAHALVYLHGYNVDFEEAAIRAAQIGFDIKVPGATAFFSWPSQGNPAAYLADEAAIEASEWAITEFLVAFCDRLGADKVHLVAHSMGNRGLLRALQRIAADAQARGRVRFGQVFLAAPDLDRDLFLELAHLYPRFAERTTLYASDADRAVHLSGLLHLAPRAGYFRPYTVAPGIDTIAVPDFDIDFLGHGYFAEAEAMLDDIHGLLRNNDGPDRRPRLTRRDEGGQGLWEMRR